MLYEVITRAVSFYEKFLKKNPQDQEINQHLASISAAVGQKRKIQASAPQPKTVVDNEQIVKLQKSLRNLKAASRYWDAVPLYQELIRISPDDHETLSTLASDIITIGQGEGDDFIVNFLSAIAPDNIMMYRVV